MTMNALRLAPFLPILALATPAQLSTRTFCTLMNEFSSDARAE